MRKKVSLSTTQIILLSFIVVILIGSLLLTLPISSSNGKSITYIDALFTATTSTCVTGLVTVPTYSTWSIFGQIVILILIQIGGLGVVSFMALFMIIINKKFNLKDNQLIQNADIELNTEIHIPLAPKSGTNTIIYNNAPIPSIINVPINTCFINCLRPAIVFKLNAS